MESLRDREGAVSAPRLSWFGGFLLRAWLCGSNFLLRLLRSCRVPLFDANCGLSEDPTEERHADVLVALMRIRNRNQPLTQLHELVIRAGYRSGEANRLEPLNEVLA